MIWSFLVLIRKEIIGDIGFHCWWKRVHSRWNLPVSNSLLEWLLPLHSLYDFFPFIFILNQVYVHVNVHVEVRGQFQVSSSDSTADYFDTESPNGLGHHQLTRLAGQWTTRIFLSPPPQKQGYKHIQPCLTFKQGSEPKSSCFWAVKLLTEPSPQPTVLFRILELSELLDFHCEGIGAELDCSLLQQGCAPNRSFQMHWRCRFGSVCSQVPYFAFTVHPPTQYVCIYIHYIYIWFSEFLRYFPPT